MLDGLGAQTGVQLGGVLAGSRLIEARLGRLLPSRYVRAARAQTAAMVGSG